MDRPAGGGWVSVPGRAAAGEAAVPSYGGIEGARAPVAGMGGSGQAGFGGEGGWRVGGLACGVWSCRLPL